MNASTSYISSSSDRQYRRPLLMVLLALTLSGCYGGSDYYESDVYTQPGYERVRPYDNGVYYQERPIYVTPRQRYNPPPPPPQRFFQQDRPGGRGGDDHGPRGNPGDNRVGRQDNPGRPDGPGRPNNPGRQDSHNKPERRPDNDRNDNRAQGNPGKADPGRSEARNNGAGQRQVNRNGNGRDGNGQDGNGRGGRQ